MQQYNQLLDHNLIEALREGAVGVLPTDTVYGLVCSVADPISVERLYELKSREHKPGTVIAANIDQIVSLGVPKRYLTAVEQFWPNPISVVIPVGDHLEDVHMGKGSVAFRIPKDQVLRDFLEQTGPLLTTSANHPGEPPANTIEEAQAYFGEGVDFYVEGGSLLDHQPSTVIRMVDDAVEVLRQGAITVTETGEIN